MAELNLKQIIDKLNTEFTGENRKLIFWYDDNGDFEEDIDSVEIANAKVYKNPVNSSLKQVWITLLIHQERITKQQNIPMITMKTGSLLQVQHISTSLPKCRFVRQWLDMG